MSKKDQRIAYLEGEIDELRKLKCTNDTLQLVKYCTEIEKIVNDPKFEPGSLKLVPRVTQARQCYGVASDVEIVIAAVHIEGDEEAKKPDKIEGARWWRKAKKEAELLSLKAEIALLNAKRVHLLNDIEQLSRTTPPPASDE